MHAIIRAHFQRRQINAIYAADIDDPPVWIDPRTCKRMDAAMAAKIVLGRHGIELIQAEFLLTGQDAQVRIHGAMPQRAAAAAD